jgi:hypothetical protein
VTAYVLDEGRHHVQNCRDDSPDSDDLLLGWLEDQPQDSLVFHVALALGLSILISGAESAEASGSMWPAACRLAAASQVIRNNQGAGQTHEESLRRAAAAISQARERSPSGLVDKIDQLELMVVSSCFMWDPERVADDYKPRMERLMSTKACKAQPDKQVNYWIICVVAPPWLSGEIKAFKEGISSFLAWTVNLCETAADPMTREYFCVFLGWFHWFGFETCLEPGFDWSIFGPGGKHCSAAVRTYDYDKVTHPC